MFFQRFGRIFLLWIFLNLVLCRSELPPMDRVERVRAYTRQVEFDFVSWTLDALGIEFTQMALGAARALPAGVQEQVVLDYLQLVAEIQDAEARVSEIYSDPAVPNPQVASALERRQLAALQERKAELAPLVEAILQAQMSSTLADLGLTVGGQPIPPVMFHSTPLPLGLIVSPREVIRQDADISLRPDLPVDQWEKLERQVDEGLNVSSLVVRIGGLGMYPTMIQQTRDLRWLVEVIAHEWVHNFLTLRPLGLVYGRDPALRTINETVASIAGKEIGRALLARYYPQHLPSPPSREKPTPKGEPSPPTFDFRAEMRITRVTVDQLLAQGKIEAAEKYMEQRRVFFWEHGYRIRKLNQAYFAFHGAYADEPGGAAGEDPVGEAVRAFREMSPSLSTFIKQLSWMTSFEQLRAALEEK